MDKKLTYEIIKKTKYRQTVMQAYLDGETIQGYDLQFNEWRDLTIEPGWNWQSTDYRIKPKPKYRPYNIHEIDMLKGKWLVRKYDRINAMVVTIEKETIHFCQEGSYSLQGILTSWTYEDGSPCGILIEE